MYTDYTYSTGLTSTQMGSAVALTGMTMVIFIVIMLVTMLLAYAISAFLLSRIFKKAGVKQSIAWIPIYNTWKMLELGDQKGYWILLSLIPGGSIVTMIFMYIAMFHIGKKLGKEDWYIALAIFVPIVWYIILGFDKSVWNGGIDASAAAPVAMPSNEQPAPVEDPEQSQMAPVPEMSPTMEAPALTEPETPIELPTPVAPVDEPTETTNPEETPQI